MAAPIFHFTPALFCLCLSIVCVFAGVGAKPIIVQTRYGPVVGDEFNDISQFLGVPYAQPPIGELRWKKPVPPQNWEEPKDCVNKPPACPQICDLPPGMCPESFE